ncbi:MAG: Stp1/IreP family PP2C-type Ser/Thr phosphatase [Clostridiales bacterium]|nr:Stp1/IreP family PP2C-type Ser/Thr phosphatase [Clostridiales bacterium]
MVVEFGAYSHVGKVRKNNEDSYYIPSNKYGIENLFMVADGMGGHNAGDVASKMLVREIADYFKLNIDKVNKSREIKELMLDAVHHANKIVYDCSLSDERYEGMGTTLTMAYFFGPKLCIAHVGDSRAYVIYKDSIEQITKDHSLVQDLLENGSITEEEIDNHPQRNVITRALGTDEEVKIDYYERKIDEKYIILLCTDGLINHVTSQEIIDISKESKDLSELARRLTIEALDDGGTDNITVIVAKYNDRAKER